MTINKELDNLITDNWQYFYSFLGRKCPGALNLGHEPNELISFGFENLNKSFCDYQSGIVKSPRNWAALLLYRGAVDELRKLYGRTNGRPRSRLTHVSEELFDSPCNRPGPEEQLENKEVQVILESFIEVLKPKEKEVFIRFFLENETAKKTSEILGMPYTSVIQKIHRIRAKYRDYINV